MEKQNINLADLTPVTPNDSNIFQRVSCAKVKKEVNDHLIKHCSSKVNKLRKCTKCKIEHKDWPLISSPMDAKYLNTAFDGVNGKLDPTNSNTGITDLHWEAGKGNDSGPASVTNWISAFVSKCLLPNTWIDSPFSNANWISLYSNSEHLNDPATGSQEKNLNVYFRYKFYLNSSINPSQFVLDMDFYADNSVHEIYVNNIKQSTFHPTMLPQAQSSNENQYRGFDNGKQVHISLANNWKTCENEIIVHVKSDPDYLGFLAQNTINCYEAKFPTLAPTINISWGDSHCDCIETDDTEIMCITICNNYSNVIFKNLTIERIRVVDENEISVPILPDGTPSVGLYPMGPYCFGDIAACSPKADNCVSREFVLINRGAKSGKYKIYVECIRFEVCNQYALNDCFEFIACYS